MDRKRRPTHLLLLLLRCLALLLLAFVFARLFVTVDDPAAAGKRDRQWLTVLLDRSASMQRGGFAAGQGQGGDGAWPTARGITSRCMLMATRRSD